MYYFSLLLQVPRSKVVVSKTIDIVKTFINMQPLMDD
jgi:hypothetical protein